MRPVIRTEEASMKHLEAPPARPPWLEAQRDLPFTALTGDEFEVFCYRLLRQENPGEEIYYYGKTRDAGRDIVRPQAPSGSELIQCKRYTASVGIGEVRKELAKLYTNVFHGAIPERPDRVTFYVAPDLTGPATDLLLHQSRWVEAAEAALRDHLGSEPPAELLEFARTWWPKPEYQTALELTERAIHHEDLIDGFFSVKKVIGVKDFRRLLREERAQTPERTPGPEGKWESFFQAVGQPEQFFFYVQEWPGLLPDQRFLAPENLSEIREAVSREPLTFLIGPPAAGKTFTAVQLLWEAYQRGLRVLWIAPPTFATTDGPIPEERSFGDMKERIRLLAHRLGPRPLQAPRDSYDFIAQHLEPGSLVYIEDPFGKTDEEFTYSLHTYDFFDLDAFIAAIQKGGSRKDCHILISSREGLFDRWQDDLKARGEERPPAKRFRIDANSYDHEHSFELARKIAQARGLQNPEEIASEVAYRVQLPVEIERVIRGLPQEATVEDAERAALDWQGGLAAAARRQLHPVSDGERLLLVAAALEWPLRVYLELHGDLNLTGDAEEGLREAFNRFRTFIIRSPIWGIGLLGLEEGGMEEILVPFHSAVTEAIASELASQQEWLTRLALVLPKRSEKHADLAIYLLSLGIGRVAGPAQDAIMTVLFNERGLTGRYTPEFMTAWPFLDRSFKERLFQYLEEDPKKIVRDLAARLEHVEVPAEDAWRLLRLLLKKRYLVAGGQPAMDLIRSHPWRYLVRHIAEIPADLSAALGQLASRKPALFTYALGEVLVEIWDMIPESFKQAFFSVAATEDRQVQEKVLRAIASHWDEIPQELRDFFLRQSVHGNWQIRAETASAAWIYWGRNPESLDPLFMRAVEDPDIRVPLAVLHGSGEYERDRKFAEALLSRVEGATAAEMLQTMLSDGLAEEGWKIDVACSCLEKGGTLARGVLAERYFSTTPPKPLPLFDPPESLATEPEVVRLGAIHAYAEGHGDRSFLSEEEAITLVEGLFHPYRDWALYYLSIQALHLPERVRSFIEGLEEAESEDGHAVREGKKIRQPKDRRRLWKFPVFWLAEALKEAEAAS